MDDTIQDTVFDFAYETAFRDATMRKAFPKYDDNDELFHNRKENAKVDARKFVRDYIDAIFNDKNSDFLVIGTINAVCEATEKYKFTFGNAQKLVNMTAKYMYLSIYGMDGYERERYREKFKYCHCPMDGRMIKNLREVLLNHRI